MTEDVERLTEGFRALLKEDKEAFIRENGDELRTLLAERWTRDWLEHEAEITMSDDDSDAFTRSLSEKLGAGRPDGKKLAEAYSGTLINMAGPIEGVADMKSFTERFGMTEEGRISFNGFDSEHRLVYTGFFRAESDILSYRITSVADLYGKRIDSVILVMNDGDLYTGMNRKLAKGLLKRLSLALRTVGWSLADILVRRGDDMLSAREFSVSR